MKRRGRPWNELDTARYQESVRRGSEIKEWRTREAIAGRPSGFDDYCCANGLCSACQTTGIVCKSTGAFEIAGWDGETQLFEECEVCGGTGRRVAGGPVTSPEESP